MMNRVLLLALTAGLLFPVAAKGETWIITNEEKIPSPPGVMGAYSWRVEIDAKSIVKREDIVYYNYVTRLLDENRKIIHTVGLDSPAKAWNCKTGEWFVRGDEESSIWQKPPENAIGSSAGKFACTNKLE